MSQTEDPAISVARLLKTKMRVIKDNGGLASVNVSGEWQNYDALKGGDGQVTVGLAECADQKIELTGKIRRRLSAIRVNVWTTDMPNASESSKGMRGKIVEEVNRIIRQNRSKPNETVYDFVGAGPNGQSYRAFSGDTEEVPNADWAELSAVDYQKLWYSEDNRCQVSCGESGKYAVLLFRFELESRENAVKQVVLGFEGYGTAPGGNGVTVKVWNHNAGAWQNTQCNQAGTGDEALTLTLLANLPDYIDDEGYVWFLARTSSPSDGTTPAVLQCDYVSCMGTVNGITYCDLASYRNLDRVDVKPFIYRTELVLKSWFIENIGV
ncbi:MAG: hypothetical protein M1356_07955 [Gammaproteobacteria bacterium]|nr:hypothetical protein [Gammaproteobacteria bacterium]